MNNCLSVKHDETSRRSFHGCCAAERTILAVRYESTLVDERGRWKTLKMKVLSTVIAENEAKTAAIVGFE